jgi:hypothetical protein
VVVVVVLVEIAAVEVEERQQQMCGDQNGTRTQNSEGLKPKNQCLTPRCKQQTQQAKN